MQSEKLQNPSENVQTKEFAPKSYQYVKKFRMHFSTISKTIVKD